MDVMHWWDFGLRLSGTTIKPTNGSAIKINLRNLPQHKFEGRTEVPRTEIHMHKNIKSGVGSILKKPNLPSSDNDHSTHNHQLLVSELMFGILLIAIYIYNSRKI